ncbi:Peroxidase [Mycena venus]|uniref:Peroxidase n=1 Tax=Mycena venus TaxID=2733690 RepID=A0A8H6YTW4_9AGAR|nr:Peroxidase [Mycena venus]
MLAFALFTCLITTVDAYTWPNPQLEELDQIRFGLRTFDADGNGGGIDVFVEPTCNQFLFDPNFQINGSHPGRTNAADWLRTAYHDMATHNVEDGTGGLDASIRFAEEQARSENAGTGFQNTITVIPSNRYVSISDFIAVAAVMAIEACGGPEIAYRGGRVDATEPNTAGVPRPEQDLDSHIASFSRQGFTQTEMIGLIACGHTFGGVQHDPFPDIAPELNDTQNTMSVAHFDTTFHTFDNNVATEYIAGTTTNPLVVGLNDTTNSDKRIFSSDGNVTMRAFAESPELFRSTCGALFTRMIDTVPRGVQLTEVIAPLPVKPTVSYILDGANLTLVTEVRFWNMSNETHTVNLILDDHAGVRGWARVNATLNATTGATNMRFLVDGKLEDQGGLGFALQDGVVFSNSSCAYNENLGRFDVAVRNDFNPSRVFLEQLGNVNTSPPIVSETDIPLPPPSSGAGYSIWSINLTDARNFYTIGAEVDGVKITTAGRHGIFTLPPCDN